MQVRAGCGLRGDAGRGGSRPGSDVAKKLDITTLLFPRQYRRASTLLPFAYCCKVAVEK